MDSGEALFWVLGREFFVEFWMEEFLEWTVAASVTFYWQALWLRVLFLSLRDIVGVEGGGGATMRVGVGSG